MRLKRKEKSHSFFTFFLFHAPSPQLDDIGSMTTVHTSTNQNDAIAVESQYEHQYEEPSTGVDYIDFICIDRDMTIYEGLYSTIDEKMMDA